MKKSTKLITPGYTLTFILVTALFYLWALPNNLNDVLIPQFMKAFELNRLQAGLVQSAFYAGYFLLAFPAAKVMDRFGYKAGLLTGLLLFSAGCFLFYPASVVGAYGFFLFALFVIASGLAFLETGANSFIAVLGPSETSEQRLNLAQAFNPLGAMTGVVAGTLFIFSGTEHSAEKVQAMQTDGTYQAYLQSEIARVGPTYLIIGAIVLLFFVLIWKAKFPAFENKAGEDEVHQHGKISMLIQFPHFRKGVVAQFFYVGAQVGTWSYMIPYLKDYMHKSEKEAGFILLGSLFLFMVGRFASTVLMKLIPASILMGIYCMINIVLVSTAILFPSGVGAYSLIATSFFMSLMFPTIFALGVKGLGVNTKLGGSFIIMAIIGGAVWTPVMGLISDKTSSLALSMIVPLIAYFFILYYALIGSKPGGPVNFDEDQKVVISH
ncbi:MAG TPA: L-fucose:H+ symporter permease [Prolixibacteraceae bacterium]